MTQRQQAVMTALAFLLLLYGCSVQERAIGKLTARVAKLEAAQSVLESANRSVVLETAALTGRVEVLSAAVGNAIAESKPVRDTRIDAMIRERGYRTALEGWLLWWSEPLYDSTAVKGKP